MGGLCRAMVLESCPVMREALRNAFDRAGMAAQACDLAEPDQALDGQGVAIPLLIVGDRGEDTRALDRVRELVGPDRVVVYLGDRRAEALAAGATGTLPRTTFARDVVMAARVLAGRREADGATTLSADLAEFGDLYYVLRGLAAARWDGLLGLWRGLRRAELRFYEGEVTSAHVGMLHGLAALHQIVLWTDARLEFRGEPVARRRQIPLGTQELLDDVARFVADISDACGRLDLATVYRVSGEPSTILDLPPHIRVIGRLFDGARTLADVVEDSPHRVLDTLRACARLEDLGVIRDDGQMTAGSPRAALAIQEWFADAPIPVVRAEIDSGPLGPLPGEPASPPEVIPEAVDEGPRAATVRVVSSPRRRLARGSIQGPLGRDSDWSAIVPPSGGYLPPGAPLVPSVKAAGEIDLRRERLEEVMDVSARDRVFGRGVSAVRPVIIRPTSEPRLEHLAASRSISGPVAKAAAAVHSVEENAPPPPKPAAEPVAQAAPVEPRSVGSVSVASPDAESPDAGSPEVPLAVTITEPPEAPVREESELRSPSDLGEQPASAEPQLGAAAEATAAPDDPAPGSQPAAPVPALEAERGVAGDTARQWGAPPASPTDEPIEPPSAVDLAEPRSAPAAPEPPPPALDATAALPPQALPAVDENLLGGIIEAELRLEPSPALAGQPGAPASEPEPAAKSGAVETRAIANSQAAFSEQEEAFFHAGAEIAGRPSPPPESFADLEGSGPKSFWKRLVSRPPR